MASNNDGDSCDGEDGWCCDDCTMMTISNSVGSFNGEVG